MMQLGPEVRVSDEGCVLMVRYNFILLCFLKNGNTPGLVRTHR